MVGGLVALLVILGVFFMLNKSDSTADMVEVPEFTATANISEARVEEQLAAKGLKLDAREDSDSSEPKGTITKQNPAGGKKVAKAPRFPCGSPPALSRSRSGCVEQEPG